MEPRQMLTLSGMVKYERCVFHCPHCRASFAPLDVEMGLEKGCLMTRRVVRAITFTGANHSFADVAMVLKENFGIDISSAQACIIANREGMRVDELAQKREEQLRSGTRPPQEQAETVVLLSDAAAILTRKGEEHKMVNVVRGFALDSRVSGEGVRPMLAQSRYSATAKEQARAGGASSDLASRILAVGCALDASQAKRVVFIADGDPSLWRICEELYPEAICIQDFWHVMEYLSAAARAVAKSEEEVAQLREEWAHALKKSDINHVIEDLKRLYRKVRSPGKRLALKKAQEYLEEGRERMDYAAFAEQGLPIGSGAIESACKHLVKERYDITGARWSRKNAGNLLALRVAIANNEWDLYWQRTPADQLQAA